MNIEINHCLDLLLLIEHLFIVNYVSLSKVRNALHSRQVAEYHEHQRAKKVGKFILKLRSLSLLR